MNNVVALCALLVAAVTAYNFEDPEFNAILADDFEEFSNSATFLHPRSRRDEEAVTEKEKCHHHHRRQHACCAADLMKKIHGEDADLKRECFKETAGKDKLEKGDPFSCKELERRKERITCVMQCVGQKMGILDSQGDPKEEEFESSLKESFSSEPWLASSQDKVISTCLDEGRNATANRDAADTTTCNPAGVKIAHCLYREIQLNCPAEQIKDEKACSRIRDRIRGRDFFQPPPPPPGASEEEEQDN
ncbi:hypothetical protein NQ315_015610 [Exocentrus adspersus]|uniref:Uncharacterized protein n=1 Tax=Exocentrus adspersus TaxID=1586481 RepID=A0AAV8W3A8_9CUCU|nr:hypothetical protein NQ315_015610 [Exocentrus adspersus]